MSWETIEFIELECISYIMATKDLLNQEISCIKWELSCLKLKEQKKAHDTHIIFMPGVCWEYKFWSCCKDDVERLRFFPEWFCSKIYNSKVVLVWNHSYIASTYLAKNIIHVCKRSAIDGQDIWILYTFLFPTAKKMHIDDITGL